METPSLSLKDTGRIYLDHNATTPPLLSLKEEVPSWLDAWGNPSSIHRTGRGPKALIRQSRQAIAKSLEVHPQELFFTSGGSESNSQVVKGVFHELSKSKAPLEFITSRVEHPSVLKSFKAIEALGAKVHYINVDSEGQLDEAQFDSLLSERTALVSIMFANNETGVVFPIKRLCEKAHRVGALFHTDAVQSLGKVKISLYDLGVDFASFSGHKIYSLKGAGFVYLKRGQQLPSLVSGGQQERGRRAGTENTLAIAALGHIFEKFPAHSQFSEKMESLRDKMEALILERISAVSITGGKEKRLPNTSSLVIEDIDGESLLMNLDLEGVSVSTGAACSSGNPEPSPTLLAMGLSRIEAQSSLRLSVGWSTTESEILEFVEKLSRVVERLRQIRKEEREVRLGSD